MSITKGEREALFAEFESRLSKKQGYASGYATVHNMERAKDHFWTKYHAVTDCHKFDAWSQRIITSSDWDMIRKLVCHANGVSIVRDIPAEKINDANELAIKLIDLLFDYNEHIISKGQRLRECRVCDLLRQCEQQWQSEL